MISEVSVEVLKKFLNESKKYKYAGLLTSEPTNFEANNEATSGLTRAARQEVEWSDVYSGGLIRNTNMLYWEGLDWGQRVTHLGLFETSSISTCGFWGQLEVPTVVEVAQNRDVDKRLGAGTFTLEATRLAIRIS